MVIIKLQFNSNESGDVKKQTQKETNNNNNQKNNNNNKNWQRCSWDNRKHSVSWRHQFGQGIVEALLNTFRKDTFVTHYFL